MGRGTANRIDDSLAEFIFHHLGVFDSSPGISRVSRGRRWNRESSMVAADGGAGAGVRGFVVNVAPHGACAARNDRCASIECARAECTRRILSRKIGWRSTIAAAQRAQRAQRKQRACTECRECPKQMTPRPPPLCVTQLNAHVISVIYQRTKQLIALRYLGARAHDWRFACVARACQTRACS